MTSADEARTIRIDDLLVAAGTPGRVSYKEPTRLAERHSRRKLDINPDGYTAWQRCLLQAFAERDRENRPEPGDMNPSKSRRVTEPARRVCRDGPQRNT